MSEKPTFTVTVNDASETKIIDGPTPPKAPEAAKKAAPEKEE